MSALQAIVFDFDGVIANSEPLHLQAFQQTLAEEGIVLSAADYYAHYLGFDDAGVFAALGRDQRLPMTDDRIEALVTRKAAWLEQALHAGAVLFPGAVDFIRAAGAAVPIAIASGAARHEIQAIVGAAGVADLFTVIVAAGDTEEGKPSPEPYALALQQLRERTGRALDARRAVAIEDSRWGLESAQRAGLRLVGVTSSYAADELPGAELVVGGLKDLTLADLDRLCQADW